MDNEEQRGTVSGPGGDIAWRRIGDGPPLLLINGYAATKDDWDPAFLGSLAAASTVICADNRGIGESGRGDSEITIGAMAEDAVALIDALQIDSASIAGWSMGGFVAQQIAATAPERIDSLVLLATDPGGLIATHGTLDAYQRLTDHTGTPRERAHRLLNLLFPPDVAEGIFSAFGDIVAEAQAKLSPELLNAQQAAMRQWYVDPADDRISAIKAPTLAASGTDDIVIPPENANLIAGQRRDSWLARFRHGGHAFMAQEPQRVGSLINTFLRR